MKSRTSCFDRALFSAALRQGRPLWIVYLIALCFCLPVRFVDVSSPEWVRLAADGGLIDSGWEVLVIVIAVASVFSVLLVFGHMYSKRQTSLICSLPVRRGTAYASCFAAGLVPMLAAELLVVLVCAAIEAHNGVLNIPVLLLLTAFLVLLTLAFYGFAACCAMLTGSAVVLPLVYLVLEVTAAAAAYMISGILTALLFGYCPGGIPAALSPLAWLASRAPTYGPTYDGLEFTVLRGNVAGMAIYAVIGLGFALLGLLLYKRRAMETVGEVVAIPVLRPIFRWCMALGCGLVFAWALCIVRGGGCFCGTVGNTVLAAVLAAVGSFVGWFGAEMLMRKSTRVFRSRRAGACAAACILVLGVLCVGTGAFGYETRVPAPEEVGTVSISCDATGFYAHDEDSVRLAEAAQRALIGGREEYARAGVGPVLTSSTYVRFNYVLDSGKLVSREYMLYDPADFPAMEDDIAALEAVLNTDEAFEARKLRTPLPAGTELSCAVYTNGPQTSYEFVSVRLEEAEALSLYAAIDKDLDARDIGQIRIFRDMAERDTVVHIVFDLYERVNDPEGKGIYSGVQTIFFDVPDTARNTLSWLRENCGIG